jgi:predicted permease
MRKRIKILIIFISIIALIFITSCFITKYIFGDTKNIEAFFDENLLQINELKCSINKRVL